MTNALAQESSPYLRQHSENPVDWLPWGERALARARELERPLLVSIGYSACHWCHVMERESFEDPSVAALMNENFVCVKVDREERPDVDAIYMGAVQAMTGGGGWPLNVFLTPEQLPFYGGTYFPPAPTRGMPSWTQVLEAVAGLWRERPLEAREAGERLREHLARSAALTAADSEPGAATLAAAEEGLRATYDHEHGGWGAGGGRGPKFPSASACEFLLARGDRSLAPHCLRAMASGGINDQVGGGFARYAVDATWTVPHFEKMLYDNALLARCYLHGWQATGDPLLRRTCAETLDFMLRELRSAEGGFFAALDADSGGVEGSFYVWTLAELHAELGPLAQEAIAYFGASSAGNFEGTNVLEARGPEPAARERAEIRSLLLRARERRERPGLDDKCLTAWNALAIAAFADAGAVLGEERYVDAARAAAAFVLGSLRDGEGRLLRSWAGGRATLPGYLEDHAFMLEALLTLYEATFEERWYVEARALGEQLLARFADPRAGGFLMTGSSSPELIVRHRDLEDTPIPSGSSSAAYGLLRLAALSGEPRYEEAALGALRLVHEFAARHPSAFGHLLQAVDFFAGPVREVALVGQDVTELARVVRSELRPRLVLAGAKSASSSSEVALLHDRSPVDGAAAAYVCERFACRAPVTAPAELAALLG